MTPVQSWSPADYYAASRAARRAWQARDQQLEIGGLEEAVAPVALVRTGGRADAASAAATASSSPPSPSELPEGGLASPDTRGGTAQTHDRTRAVPRKESNGS